MTSSTFDLKLDEIQASITTQRALLKRAKENLSAGASTLGALPTVYAETAQAASLLATTGYEGQQLARWNAYVAEFISLKTQADAAVTAMEPFAFEG